VAVATPQEQDAPATHQGSTRFQHGHQHEIIHEIEIREKIQSFKKASRSQTN
jgi:hypothetical protein